jgi:uncharacterized protein
MFIRLLIWGILGLLVYRALKSWFAGSGQRQVRTTRHPPKRVDDVMVQDPQCGVYFARKDGVPLTMNGQEILFCSDKCRDLFSAKKE